MRRLPVFILIDTSSSMRGEPIEAVKIGLDSLVSALRTDPFALESAYISIITFATEARVAVPLTEVAAFTAPDIEASGVTAMGGALTLLGEQIKTEVRTTADGGGKGDWKPLVFLLTDGLPTDDLDMALDRLDHRKVRTIVACGAGDGADVDTLKKITENVVMLSTLDQTGISAFFEWVSSSISVTSQKVDLEKKDEGGLGDLPPPPDEIKIAL